MDQRGFRQESEEVFENVVIQGQMQYPRLTYSFAELQY